MRKHFIYFFIFSIISGLLISSCNQQKKNPENNNKLEEKTTLSKIDSLDLEIIKDSLNAELFNQRAIAYLNEGNTNQALADINNAIQIDENNPAYYISLADIYLRMSNIVQSKNALLKAKNLDEQNITSLLKLGEVLFIMREYKEAIKYLNMALTLDLNEPVAYLIKGYCYLEGGDTIRAVENFRTSANKNPENYEAYMQLALIFSAQKNDLAEDYFKNAIDIQAKSLEAWYGLGMYYQNKFQVDKALETYKRLIEIAPEFKNSYYNIAYINMVMLENFEEAIGYFTKAIEIDPNYIEAIYNRGFCYENLNMINEAVNDYKKSLELETNYQIAIDALNRLSNN